MKDIVYSGKNLLFTTWKFTDIEARLWFVNELARLLKKPAGSLYTSDFRENVFKRTRSLR